MSCEQNVHGQNGTNKMARIQNKRPFICIRRDDMNIFADGGNCKRKDSRNVTEMNWISHFSSKDSFLWHLFHHRMFIDLFEHLIEDPDYPGTDVICDYMEDNFIAVSNRMDQRRDTEGVWVISHYLLVVNEFEFEIIKTAKKIRLGFKCSQPDACNDTNAVCNGTCICQPGYYDDTGVNDTDGTCTEKVHLGSKCPHDTEACLTPHAECGISSTNQSGVCVCRKEYYGTKKTKPEGECRNVTELKVTAINYTMITEESISITWTASCDPDAVNYYVVEHKSSVSNDTGQTVEKNTSATLRDLFPGQRYSIKIKSVNNNTSLYERSTYVEFYQISKPNTPGNLIEKMDIDASSGNITLTWTKPKGVVTGYIGFLETLLFEYNQSFRISGTMLNQTFYGVKSGTWYNFTVQSISGYNDTDTLYSNIYRESIKTKVQDQPPPSVEALAGGIAGGVTALIVIVVIIVLWQRKRNNMKKASKLLDDATGSNMENLIKVRKERPINLANFAEYVTDYHRDSNLKFSQEYEDLKTMSQQHAHEAADMEENRLKNRFVNILPFDHSRVRLLPIDDVPGSDYINANYLPGFTKTREYIGCQGPIPATIDDHWRMIWEQNVRVIVMLTQYKEENRVKCEPYMPLDLKDPKQYGDLVVECLTYSSMNSFEYRTLKIRLGEKERTIKHFHFLCWRDYSANVQFDTMIDFIKTVRKFMQPPDKEGPTIVHCSAGVGRTGTYITLDYVIQHIDNYGPDSTVDIFNFVLKMRENRTTMVQTEQQYIFIHDCILEYLNRFKTYENQGFSNEDENVYQNTEAVDVYQNMNFNSFQKTEL
ncbi:hypothetical protein CHS0354_009272 [Potamilus streckersoni]|uniref:protein-tyrosine-phosphatase n=1 Tax=Potamilus streckersoni TaxID=2493646 RepID=A0AAE0S2W5_9BIVA|nr:hypothetical protein CHS0354_009272 [Potamilus streckersoni]